MSVARIASIHFAPVEAKRAIYGGFYALPAVPLNSDPVVIDVMDKLQRDEGPFSLGQNGGRIQLRYETFGLEEIAPDLIREWTTSGLEMAQGCHPGIWIVRDRIPIMTPDGSQFQLDHMSRRQYRVASPEERQQMWDEDLAYARQADRTYADACFVQGNAWAAKNNGALIPWMPKVYKLAAIQYGLEAMWTKKDAAAQLAPCPYCTTPVSKSAIVCPKCTNVINLEAYARYEAKKEAEMQRARRVLKEEEKLAAQAPVVVPGVSTGAPPHVAA